MYVVSQICGARDVASINVWECQRLPGEQFFVVTSVLVTVVHQSPMVQYIALQKYIVLPYFDLQNSKFSGCGGDSPPIPPLSFVPVWCIVISDFGTPALFCIKNYS